MVHTRATLLFGASLLSSAIAFLPRGVHRAVRPQLHTCARPKAVGRLYMTAADDDYPSDTAADDGIIDIMAQAAGSALDEVAGEREKLKSRLYQLGARTNRGQFADIEQQNDAINLVAQLEAMGPCPSSDWDDVQGRWELVYSDVAPFRISPFFLTLGKLFGAEKAAEDFFRLHRLATSGSEIGVVRQIITGNELVSEVEISTGIPSVPFAIKGTVVTRATCMREGDRALRLSLKSTGVTDSNLFGFINGGSLPELPIGELLGNIGGLPSVVLTTYYMDKDLRITRTDDDRFFVFTRAEF